jgi:hypothetical protein
MKELEELRTIWQSEEPEGVLNFTVSHITNANTKAIQKRVRWSPIWDLMIGAIVLFAIGNFAADNLREFIAYPMTALPAALVAALEIFVVNVSVRQLILTSELDYTKPIVETQVGLAKLRKLRIQALQWTFIFGFAGWIIFPILLVQMLGGVRIMESLPPAWILGNIGFAVAMIPVILWIVNKSRFAKSLQDAIAGKDIIEAEAFLGEIREFRSA